MRQINKKILSLKMKRMKQYAKRQIEITRTGVVLKGLLKLKESLDLRSSIMRQMSKRTPGLKIKRR